MRLEYATLKEYRDGHTIIIRFANLYYNKKSQKDENLSIELADILEELGYPLTFFGVDGLTGWFDVEDINEFNELKEDYKRIKKELIKGSRG